VSSTNGKVHREGFGQPPIGGVGTLYGVGVGPGDPELLTLKAARILGSVPIVYVPVARAEAPSYAAAIIADHIDPARQQISALVFAMRGDAAIMAAQWEANARIILAHLRTGADAAFATEGDPMLYSTFVHVARAVTELEPRTPIAYVPGISSVNAVAAAAGLPLGDRDERIAILPATYAAGELREALASYDTVVLLKVASALEEVLDTLDELGLLGQAVCVRRCGRPEEEIIRDVRTLRGASLDYFSTMIVRQAP
jgi:precorrin-2/cobalt-factor-2 C20-methyltransferase